ncbi:putative transcriptional regulator [Klebsiella phage vB_KaeD_HazelMika]|nr:putative transcriptional regulator [Klebsiella phage vB_KaeD_HazelMika]
MIEVDKRTINGNNGTQRGADKKKRKRPTGYYVLKDEVKAGLRARLEMLIEFYGSKANVCRELKISNSLLTTWIKNGMISARGAQKAHNAYKRNGAKGFRATWCRPDLTFDGNGKPLTVRCKKREMMRVVREDELAHKPEQPSWKRIKREREAALKAKE